MKGKKTQHSVKDIEYISIIMVNGKVRGVKGLKCTP